MSAPQSPDARQRLIDAALECFAAEGIGATGIETLLARADVAKMTLYKHFGSKEGLVRAALEAYGAEVRRGFFEAMERAESPRGAILAVFETAARLVTSPHWRGCLFARAALEYGPAEAPAHQVAVEHQHLLLERLEACLRAGGLGSPQQLSQALLCLLDGLLLRSHVLGDPAIPRAALAGAGHLLDAAGLA